jgi:hypothetical protein
MIVTLSVGPHFPISLPIAYHPKAYGNYLIRLFLPSHQALKAPGFGTLSLYLTSIIYRQQSIIFKDSISEYQTPNRHVPNASL